MAGYAPQENGPSQRKEHFWDQVEKTMAKLPRRTSIIFGRDFNGDLPAGRRGDRVAASMRESHGQWSAHQRDLQSSAALESIDWAARSVPPNAGWEGNTWRGYTGEQSRPDHILLSVDLASPPVTVDFLSSRNLGRTALALIDHAPLRITLRYRFRAFGQRGGGRRFDRARLAAATTNLHFAKQFVDEVQRWAQANLDKLEQLAQEAHLDPSWQYMENSILELAMTAFQAGNAPKREREHDGPDHQEGGCGQSCSAVGAACGHYTDASKSLHVSWPALSCVPSEGSQIKSDVVAIQAEDFNDYKTMWRT